MAETEGRAGSAYLKLVALDEADLAIVSSHVQDAVLKVADLAWLARDKRFVLGMNRFAWETAKSGRAADAPYERRRAALHFERVTSVRSKGIAMARKNDVLALLAIRFMAEDAPAGDVELLFAGGGTIRLRVECLEAQLTDLGASWAAASMPDHEGQ